MFLALVVTLPRSAQAANFIDSFFPPLTFKQPGNPQRPGLWFINDGDLHNGSYQYYSNCGDSSCIRSKREGLLNWYLSTTMFHDKTPGNYVNMEASELQTGYAYGKGYENTHPTAGYPVVTTGRIRCFSCNPDGSGGQVGSWGLWQWNSYPQVQADGSFIINPINSLGFSWLQQGGIFPGLQMSVLQDGYPVYLQAVNVPGLNLKQWHNYKVVWAKSTGSDETVTFYIDGTNVGNTVIAGGMPSLSETFWHDNQLATGFDQNGNLITTFMNPTTTQSVDVNFISVTN